MSWKNICMEEYLSRSILEVHRHRLAPQINLGQVVLSGIQWSLVVDDVRGDRRPILTVTKGTMTKKKRPVQMKQKPRHLSQAAIVIECEGAASGPFP
jgi:hypothetical protein